MDFLKKKISFNLTEWILDYWLAGIITREQIFIIDEGPFK